MATRITSLIAVLCALALPGCVDKIKAPTAAATGPARVATGSVVQLDGQASSDPQLLPLAYAWSFASLPEGSGARLNDAAVVNPSFTADVPGDYVVRLVVDNGTIESAPVLITVTAGPCGLNPPTVDDLAADPASPATGDLVQLTADVSDPDAAEECGGPGGELVYAWEIVSQPAGSAARLNNAASDDPSFVADVPGEYTLRLVVTDATGLASEPGFLGLTVSECGSRAPAVDGISATPASPNTGQTVQLTATISDADATAPCSRPAGVSYAWSLAALPAGSAAALNAPAASNPSFTPDVPGRYVVEVVVTDAAGLASAPKRLDVTASACGNAVPDVTGVSADPAAPATGQDVRLSAVFTYEWVMMAMPVDARATLNITDSGTPWFTANRNGTYVIYLWVTDSTGRRSPSPAVVTITATNT